MTLDSPQRVAPSLSSSIIDSVDLTKVYKGSDFRAVDDLNLSVAPREDLQS
jgi:hypothetical protein